MASSVMAWRGWRWKCHCHVILRHQMGTMPSCRKGICLGLKDHHQEIFDGFECGVWVLIPQPKLYFSFNCGAPRITISLLACWSNIPLSHWMIGDGGHLVQWLELGSDWLPKCTTCPYHMCLCGLLSVLLTGDELAFVISNKTFFKLPLQYVANSNISGHIKVSVKNMAPSDSTRKKPSKGQLNKMISTILHAWTKFMHAGFQCGFKQVGCWRWWRR